MRALFNGEPKLTAEDQKVAKKLMAEGKAITKSELLKKKQIVKQFCETTNTSDADFHSFEIEEMVRWMLSNMTVLWLTSMARHPRSKKVARKMFEKSDKFAIDGEYVITIQK